MITYSLTTLNYSQILLRSDGVSIPFAPDNTDYQAYLKWVDEGGIPEPADE